MDVEEGRKLLDELLAWTTQPRFIYRHEWSVGDMLIWDNTGVLHRAEPSPADSGRIMHRTPLMGEVAFSCARTPCLRQLGRASGRGRGCRCVSSSVVAVSFN